MYFPSGSLRTTLHNKVFNVFSIRQSNDNSIINKVFNVFSIRQSKDDSPDSNRTLEAESDSSGVFMSLSNQSAEEAGSSDSDQPMSASDLGSSSTSLDRDGEEGAGPMKGEGEWGRAESSELQWCYPKIYAKYEKYSTTVCK